MFNWDKISKEDRIYIECLEKKLDEQEKQFNESKDGKKHLPNITEEMSKEVDEEVKKIVESKGSKKLNESDEDDFDNERDINAIKELPIEDVYQAYLNGDITYDEYREICVDRDERVEVPDIRDANYDPRAVLLAKYLDVDIDDIQEDGTNNYTVDGGEQEWLVLTADEAEDKTRESLEDGIAEDRYDADPSYMDDDALADLAYNEIVDWVDNWDDDEVVEYCIDNDLVDEGEIYAVDEEESIEQRRVVYSDEIREDVDINDLRDKVIEDKQDEYDNPRDYFEDHWGYDWYTDEFFRDYIDWDSWIDDVIESDGYAPTLAWYDGEEVDLGSIGNEDYYGYRRN